MQHKPTAGQPVRHIRKQEYYRVVNIGLVKINDIWVEAVIYKAINPDFSDILGKSWLVRELPAFMTNFEEA